MGKNEERETAVIRIRQSSKAGAEKFAPVF